MSLDPPRCYVEGCPYKPLYKMGDRGVCAQHRAMLVPARMRQPVAIMARVNWKRDGKVSMEPIVGEEPDRG